MIEVTKGTGSTASERYLAKLADRTFLNLWVYPNPYTDKKADGCGQGKELCDVLAVCGDHVIIFSDKAISWPPGDDIDLSWSRWYKRAIKKSVDQVRGAERWIKSFPDRIFLDPECTKPFPIPLPPPEKIKVIGILVALGAGEACKKFFGGGSGSFLIKPDLKGDDHITPTAPKYAPFTIGDVRPDGDYIHVFDDATLDVAMQELDTITDFTGYLDKKEKLIRSGRLEMAHGEEDLIAHYMTRLNAKEEHDFILPGGRPWKDGDRLSIEATYAEMRTNAQYLAKKEADKISYAWDALIQTFTGNMIKGTTLVFEGEAFDVKKYEIAVRYMALEPRFRRRMLSQSVIEALDLGKKAPRFTRIMLPGENAPSRDTGFFFMTLEHRMEITKGDYAEYRRARRNMLHAYALGVGNKYRFLKRIIGIATEPPSDEKGRGSSQDILMLEPGEWTPALTKQAEDVCNQLDILIRKPVEKALQGDEFPRARGPVYIWRPPPSSQEPLNRHQRRAMEAKERKK